MHDFNDPAAGASSDPGASGARKHVVGPFRSRHSVRGSPSPLLRLPLPRVRGMAVKPVQARHAASDEKKAHQMPEPRGNRKPVTVPALQILNHALDAKCPRPQRLGEFSSPARWTNDVRCSLKLVHPLGEEIRSSMDTPAELVTTSPGKAPELVHPVHRI